MKIEIKSIDKSHVQTFIDGKEVGDVLNDNSYIQDGFRYHDIIHLSIFEVLNWSPVLENGLFNKNVPGFNKTLRRDRVQEEVISYLIFLNYKQYQGFEESIIVPQIIRILSDYNNLETTPEKISKIINLSKKRLSQVVIGQNFSFEITRELDHLNK